MAPFHSPWSTFLAWVVAGVAVIAAVVWAVMQREDKTDTSGSGKSEIGNGK